MSSCNADGTLNRDDVTVWINGIKLDKVSIDSSNGSLLDHNGALTEGDCSTYFTQTIAPPLSVNVSELEKFTLDIRHRNEEDAQAYIHDIEVTCTPIPESNHTSNYTDYTGESGEGSSISTHDEYCVSGNGFTDDLDYLNGEYTLYYDENGDPQEDDNGYYYFRKHDLNGVSYLYLEDNTTWVIGDTLNGDILYFECAEEDDPDTNQYFLYLDQLNCDSDIILTPNECEDQHTIISVDDVIDEVTKTGENAWHRPICIVMIVTGIFVFVISCVFGCVKLHRFRMRERYERVAQSENDSADSDAFNNELNPL